MAKPLLIDLGYMRIGIFQKITKSEDSPDSRINVHYTPILGGGGGLSGLVKDVVITDVPKGSLVGPIQPFHPRCPNYPVVVLLAAENGEAPFMNKYLGDEINRIILASERVKEQADIKEAIAERKTRRAASKEDVVMQDKIDALREVAKVRPFYATKGKRPLEYYEALEGE